jgi:hypothetical protein
LFGHAEPHTLEARRWLFEQVGAKERAMEIHDLEGYDEIIQKIVTSLPPEQVLSAFKPEQRLAGLPPDQAVLALPDELLRALSDEYLSTLPATIRAVIRDRIGR